MRVHQLKCSNCGKVVNRSSGRVNEANRFGWKTYCSLKCLGRSRNTRQECICSNPGCKKTFSRKSSEIKSINSIYCSSSCAATHINHKYPIRFAKVRTCLLCAKHYYGRRKYCSDKCAKTGQIKKLSIGKEELIRKIEQFYQKNGRIPLKAEFKHYPSAMRTFGTWNKAVRAAGYATNPVLFAKKYIANDGHKCDSFAEKIIDDWFYTRKIPHQINVPYEGTKMTADFKVNETLIEFFGLRGQLKSYDRLADKKEKLIKDRNLKIISLYPKDLFPKNHLNILFKSLLENTVKIQQ